LQDIHHFSANLVYFPRAMPITPIFELDHTTRRENGREILKSVSLTIRPGEFVALLGPSGAGKTTILRLFNGLDSPSEGSIRYRSKNLFDYPITDLRRKVGMVFQTPAILEGTLRDNLLIFQRWRKDFAATDGDLAQRLVQVGLTDTGLDQEACSLSGGEQQRLALARTLLNEPDVLLLDEPTSNLDPQLAQRILRRIKKVREELGLTVIMVSHDHQLAAKFAERFIILIDGELVEDGSINVLKKPKNSAVRAFLNGEG